MSSVEFQLLPSDITEGNVDKQFYPVLGELKEDPDHNRQSDCIPQGLYANKTRKKDRSIKK